MGRPRHFWIFTAASALAFTGYLIAQDDLPLTRRAREQAAAAASAEHADCTYFGSQRERFVTDALQRFGGARKTRALSATTEAVMRAMAVVPGGTQTYTFDKAHEAGSIDSYIWADFQKHGITPAPKTTDWEFVRRATLDLTGRIPKADRAAAFVADGSTDKRSKLIDELLADPAWTDKWTMFFGDLYQNTQTKSSTGLQRLPQGRNAFYQWIHDSLAANKPYNQMASELISAATTNTYNDGAANWMLNGWITGGPTQDIMDQATSFVFDTFLGITHVNCILCHNGRGHLDQLSLWGSSTTRYQAWQLASYMSHTTMSRTPVDASNTNVYYWNVVDNPRATDYAMNATTGNRPSRVAPTGCKSGQPCFYVPPQYIFNGDAPRSGENYRVALARNVTNDFQFARATVNYMWAQFFGRGIVDPPDTFDPARLDPNKPPPAPWTLQPSNAELLNALAQHFIDSKYDLRGLMREIANSDTYQLSSRYNGTWKPEWEQYFARKFVRRLWAEEVHDAVAQSSGTLPSYTITGFTDLGFSKPSFAMQLPDSVTNPGSDVG